MAKCIKCNHVGHFDEMMGSCPNCGINRGWKGGNAAGGGLAVFCKGCQRGSGFVPCPKCGHRIMGPDMFAHPVEDAIASIAAIVVVIILFVLFGLLAR
jgi:hypothetical protein